MPSQNPSEGGESTSAAETVKNLFKKNKTKILVVGGAVLVVVAGVVSSLAEGQDSEGAKGAKDFEKSEPPAAEVQKRQSPAGHPVAGHQRTLPDGRIVEVSGMTGGFSRPEARMGFCRPATCPPTCSS